MPQQSRAGRDGPLITIVVAAYNAAEFIDRAIKSAGEQVGVSLEFLVVDDASTDNTLAVMTEMARLDSRIIPISSKVNLGPAGARNLALDLAQGDWIAVLDSDDSFKPNRLNEMVRVATEVAADIVIDDFVSVDAKGTMLDGACLADRRGSGTIALEDWISFNSFTRAETSFGYAKPLISRVFLEQAKLRYNGTLRNGEDFHLILEALLSEAKVHFSARTGYVYTRREGSVSRRAQNEHLLALLAADDDIAARLDPQTQAKACAYMSTRRANLINLRVTEQVLGHLKARQTLNALRCLIQYPGSIGRVIGHLGEALGKRVKARR